MSTTKKNTEDTDILAAAIIGYQVISDAAQQKIKELTRRLKGGKPAYSLQLVTPSPSPNKAAPPKKHRISAEGRARIAAAQRKRWAAAKKSA